jgi:microcystin-dependent protein
MDEEDDGFATGLTNTICRDGQSTTTARIPFAQGVQVSVGAVGTPSLNYAADTDTGTYSPGADQWAVTAGGTQRFLVNAGAISVTGTFAVSGATTLTGAVTCSSTLGVTGNFAVSNHCTIAAATGNIATDGTLNVTGAATLSSTLGVTGASTFTGAGTFSSTLGVTGNFAVATNKFTVAAASGNTVVAGTLGVTGAATLSSTLAVTGTATFTQPVQQTSPGGGNAALLPAGSITAWGGSTGVAIPTGWLECNGQIADTTTDAALFAVLGNAYNIGGETGTQFRLPNLTGRTIFGQEASASRITAASGITSTTIGSVGGADTTTIAQANLPNVTLPNTLAVAAASTGITAATSSSYIIDGGTNQVGTGGSTVHVGNTVGTGVTVTDPTHTHSITGSVTSGGSGTALTNMPPAMILRWIMKR